MKNKFNKLILEINTYLNVDELNLPSTFKPVIDSCMLASEILTHRLLKNGREDFKIIEGYITIPNTDAGNITHTWIEKDGYKIDPTKKQWGVDKIIYNPKNRTEYKPDEYLDLCEKYPEYNPKKYLGEFYYIGTCISTVDDSCVWDATEMSQIIEGSDTFNKKTMIKLLESVIPNELKIENITEVGINNNIVWLYDDTEDIHYFFRQ